MKTMKLKKLFLSLIIIGYVCLASAHEQAGTLGRKNSTAAGTDIFQIDCYDDDNGDPHHLIANVSDLRPVNPALIGIQITSLTTGQESKLSIDPKDNDGKASADVKVVSDRGPYQVKIQRIRTPKDKKGVEVYFMVFHCETATGAHTGTSDPVMKQNQ